MYFNDPLTNYEYNDTSMMKEEKKLQISGNGVDSTTALGHGRYKICVSGKVLSDILDGSITAASMIPLPIAIGWRVVVGLIVWAVKKYALPNNSGICILIQLHYLSSPTVVGGWVQ